MRIKFNGTVEEKRGGCSSCGKRASRRGFVRVKEIYFPNNTKKTYRANTVYEVSDEEAEFLLDLEGFTIE